MDPGQAWPIHISHFALFSSLEARYGSEGWGKNEVYIWDLSGRSSRAGVSQSFPRAWSRSERAAPALVSVGQNQDSNGSWNKMFIPELKRHPGYCLKGHLNIQFALLATGPTMQGRGRLSGWSNVLCIWWHGSGGLQRAILKITVESRHIALSSEVMIVCSFVQQGPTKHLHGPHSMVGRHSESIPWLHHY